MSRQFSLATVYRMVSNELLAQFFVQLKNPCYGMDWENRPRRHIESIDALMQWFDPPQRETAEHILRNVFDLACRTGHDAIHHAARNLDQSACLKQLSDQNLYCQAMWTWLHVPKVFELALLLHAVDGVCWWSQRNDLPAVDARTDEEALGWLANDVSRLLEQHQGRGRQCTIEHVCREDGMNYFFCFPDDHIKTVIVHDEQGRLVTRTLRQTFEILFAYSRRQGTLELSARVGKRLRERLEKSFAWMILNERIGPRDPQVYDLNRLKDRHFQLETDPADHVLARVQRLRFQFPDCIRTITLESAKGPSDAMREMVEECLNHERCVLDDLKITEARIQLQFHRTTRHQRQSMTFNVADPDRCNLRRFHPERVAIARCNLRRFHPERVAIARKHLKMWSIAK